MQPNKSKATLQLVIATLLSLFGILLLGAAFVTAPPGEIHSSVLIAYGEGVPPRRPPLRLRPPPPALADAHASPPASPCTAPSPSPYHPHPLSPPPQHTLPAHHAPPGRHTRPLHTHLTTPYHLPFILYLYICTSHPPPAARPHPALSSPLLPFCTAPHPSSAHSHPILSTSQLSFYTPPHPSSVHPPLHLPRKSLHSPA